MEYSFNVEVAEFHGVNEAIMIKNLQFWLNKNRAQKINFHEGRYWTYNSAEAWSILFPFWTPSQIRRILKSLIDQGVIVDGNFNKISYDRTKWYAFHNEEKWLKMSNPIKNQTGFIYVIKNDIGNTKIGVTSNLERRFRELKPSSIISTHETYEMFKDESKLHDIFKEKRIKGEWFSLNEDDFNAINNFKFTIYSKEEMGLFKRGNGNTLNDGPIPDDKPDDKDIYKGENEDFEKGSTLEDDSNKHPSEQSNQNSKYFAAAAAPREDYTEEMFLQRWKDARKYYDKKETNFKKLSFQESQNFKNLVKAGYTLKDFEGAIAGLFFQDTYDAVRIRPTHLLEQDRFETYLDCWKNNTKAFKKDKKSNSNLQTGML